MLSRCCPWCCCRRVLSRRDIRDLMAQFRRLIRRARRYAAGASQDVAKDLAWRDFLADPRLQQLVEIALRNNRDLRVAALNVQVLQAQFRIQSAALFPQVSAVAERSRARTPADLSRTGAADTAGSYTVGASFGWELDFFGKLRSLRGRRAEPVPRVGGGQAVSADPAGIAGRRSVPDLARLRRVARSH